MKKENNVDMREKVRPEKGTKVFYIQPYGEIEWELWEDRIKKYYFGADIDE